MKERAFLWFAVGVLSVVGIGALSLRDDGIQFPDGSVQTTAGQPAGAPLQVEVFVNIADLEFCSSITVLYNVPADKLLLIEWVGIESLALLAADPVDVDIEVDAGDGGILHPVVRLTDSQSTAGSFFVTQRWSNQVRLYGAAGTPVRAQACRDGDLDAHVVRITFSGKLFDA